MTLEPLPEDWSRVLCVVAHPDDMEYGGAAAVARWTRAGKGDTFDAGVESLRRHRA